MPPFLRSSAPNTPTAKSSTASDTPTSTPRKAPHCTKCGRPRAGHPRSGCPFVSGSPLKRTGNATTPPAEDENLTNALGSMHIRASVPARGAGAQAVIRDHRRSPVKPNIVPSESLLSLSTSTSEILEMLRQPGMFADDDEGAPESSSKVVQWQATVIAVPKTERKVSTRVSMPGTLVTPSPDISFGSTQVSSKREESPAAQATSTPSAPSRSTPSSGSLGTSQPTVTPPPLVRSMSVEERSLFISGLTKASAATVYVVPKADIQSLYQSATARLGFHARAVVNTDDRDPQGLLILGQDEKAVQDLFLKVQRGGSGNGSRGRGLRAAAGGAVVGAVGAWAGLAFS